MGDIPTITSQVQPTVQPGVDLPMNATPQAFGAELGQAEETGGEVATKLHADAVTHANQTMALDQDNKANEWIQQNLHDPKTGLLNQETGKDAPQAVDRTLADYDAMVSKNSDGLVNDAQKEQYQRMTQLRRLEIQRQLGAYEHVQTTRWQNQTDESAVKLAGDAAIQNAGTTDPLLSPDNFIQKQRTIIATSGQRNRLPPEAIQEQMNAAESATHVGVITQLVSTGQDQAAKAWYDDHKEELVGRDREIAAQKVEVGSNAGTALRIGDELVRPNDQGQMPQRADLMTKIAGMNLSPQARELAENRVNRLLAEHEQDVRQNQQTAAQGAMQVLQDPQNNLGLNDPRVQQARLQMSPEQWSQVQAMGRKDGRVLTDWRGEGGKAYNDFHAMATTQATRSAALAIDIPTTYGGIMGDGELKELISLQDGLRREQESGKPDEKLASATMLRQIGSDTLVGHGFAGKIDEANPGTPDNPTPANKFIIDYQNALRRSVDARLAMDPKLKPTPELIQQEADKLLIKHATGQQSRGFWGGIISAIPMTFNVRTGETPSEYPFQNAKFATTPLAPSELPKGVHAEISAQFLARRGRQPTPPEVMEIYYRNQDAHDAP